MDDKMKKWLKQDSSDPATRTTLWNSKPGGIPSFLHRYLSDTYPLSDVVDAFFVVRKREMR